MGAHWLRRKVIALIALLSHRPVRNHTADRSWDYRGTIAAFEKSFQETDLRADWYFSQFDACRDPAAPGRDPQFAMMVNLLLFQSLFARDLAATLQQLLRLPDGWSRTFHARIAALLITEFLQDTPNLLGKDFRATTLLYLTTDEDRRALDRLCKDLSALETREHRHLADIRNVSIAHRDHDARRQRRQIQNMDVDHIVALCDEVIKLHLRLVVFLRLCTEKRLRQDLLRYLHTLIRFHLLSRTANLPPGWADLADPWPPTWK